MFLQDDNVGLMEDVSDEDRDTDHGSISESEEEKKDESDTEVREITPFSSLSQRSPLICGVNFYVCGHLFSFFGVGLPAYLSNHNLFSREKLFSLNFSEIREITFFLSVL